MVTAMTMTAFAPLVIGVLVHHFGAVGLVAGIVTAQTVSAVVALTAKGIRRARTPDQPPTAPTDAPPSEPVPA